MDPATLRERIREISIFARAVPEQKLRLVEALKANGEIVAMTGDGVNDAPALQAAHIGIAMGARGTDVAREAADLVLLDDDFSSIVKAVRMGRRVFDNLKKAMAYIIAIHVPIAGLSFLPVLLGWPLILGPVHIAFLELIIDPSCSIVFEAEKEEAGIMRRRPRSSTESLFQRRFVGMSVLQGAGMLAISLAIFAVAYSRGQGEADARALTFTALVLMNLALIATSRSRSLSVWKSLRQPNPAMWWVTGSALVLLALVLYVPWLRSLFHFSTLHPVDIALCLGAGVAGGVWFEAVKRFEAAALLLASGQRLIQIPENIVEIFEADRQADHVGLDAGRFLLARRSTADAWSKRDESPGCARRRRSPGARTASALSMNFCARLQSRP